MCVLGIGAPKVQKCRNYAKIVKFNNIHSKCAFWVISRFFCILALQNGFRRKWLRGLFLSSLVMLFWVILTQKWKINLK